MMDKQAIMESLDGMDRNEMIDLIDSLNLDVKKVGKNEELRAEIKTALEVYDPGQAASASKNEEAPATDKDAAKAKEESASSPAVVIGKSVKGTVMSVANVQQGKLSYSVLSIQADLPGAGILKIVGTAKQGDSVEVPVI